MGILNYTTTIRADKTAGEIVGKLAKHGASVVASTYTEGKPTGIAFTIKTEFGPKDFRLPINADGVHKALRSDKTVPARLVNPEQAERVAWRILKDWVEAQIAIIDAGQATLDEVMLPYMLNGNGRTVAQIYRAQQGRLAIEASPADDDEVVDAELVS